MSSGMLDNFVWPLGWWSAPKYSTVTRIPFGSCFCSSDDIPSCQVSWPSSIQSGDLYTHIFCSCYIIIIIKSSLSIVPITSISFLLARWQKQSKLNMKNHKFLGTLLERVDLHKSKFMFVVTISFEHRLKCEKVYPSNLQLPVSYADRACLLGAPPSKLDRSWRVGLTLNCLLTFPPSIMILEFCSGFTLHCKVLKEVETKF